MQKNSKRIFTAVLTVLFVLSVSYFATLAPTTAWFYQEETKNYSFAFGDFEASAVAETTTVNVDLRAATRFADAGEWLFDEVAYIHKVKVTNGGELAGLVTLDVDITNNPGIRWFVYDTAANTTEVTTNELPAPNLTSTLTNGNKGYYKPQIETMLSNYGITPVTFSGESDYNQSSSSSYISKAIHALDQHNSMGVVVPASGTSTAAERCIYIVFWAEYGDFKTNIEGGSAWYTTVSADVTVTAQPYLAWYNTQTAKSITVTNSSGESVALDAYFDMAVDHPSDYSTATTYHNNYIINSGESAAISVQAGRQVRLQLSTSGKMFTGSNDGFSGTNNTVYSVNAVSDNVTLTVDNISA